MESDPIIDEIREVRHRISEEHGHDPRRLVEHYIQMEKSDYADRLIKPQKSTQMQESPRE
jgi:hypothetical protein